MLHFASSPIDRLAPPKPFDALRVFSALVLVFLMAPTDAFAVGSTGDMFCNVFRNSGSLPFLTSALAYISGGVIFGRGIYDLIKRSTDPNTPLRNGLLGVCVGCTIGSMPWLVQWLHHTLYGQIDSSYGTFDCTPDTTTINPGAPLPLDQMLFNFVRNIYQPLTALLSALAVILGGFMIFFNMVKLSKLGVDGKAQNLTPIATRIGIGALLMAVGQTLDVSLNTLFGDIGGSGGIVKYSGIAYEPKGAFSMDRFNTAMVAVFAFLYLIGLLSFIRGFFILGNAVEGQGQQTKGQAFTHMIGGTLLVNMPGFIRVIENTTGIDIIKG